MKFPALLSHLIEDLMETESWSLGAIENNLAAKIAKMQRLSEEYGEDDRIRGGAAYLVNLYDGNPKNHFDDLISDQLSMGEPWGRIYTALVAEVINIHKRRTQG